MRRMRLLLSGLAAIALLVGCVAIPTSGAVSRYSLRGTDEVPRFNFLARPPVTGASQDDILAGFIQAGIDTQNRYAVAKQYLTTEMAARWNPVSSVLVTDGSRNLSSRVDENAVTLTVQASARVDASGRYTTDQGAASLSFSFAKQRGQWRISSAPDGTVLSPYNFFAVFAAYPLYFLDPTGAFLVPDLRWYPADPTAAARVVRGLLAGPAAWLGTGAVVSAFPRGTQLGTDGVTIAGNVATVDLSPQVLGESPTGRRRMATQLQSTLASIATLSSVRLTVRGVAVDVSASADGSSPTADPQVGASTIAFGASALGQVSGSGLRPLPLSARAAGIAPGPAVLDRGQTTLVIRTAQGVERVPVSGAVALIDTRPALVAPSIDPEGFVWSAQSSGIGTLLAIDPKGGAAHPIASPSPSSAGTLVAMRVSRDGSRIAFGVLTEDGPVIQVAAIQRDSSLVPTALGPLETIPAVGGNLVDLAWMDPVSIAYISRDVSGTSVRAQQVGGRVTTLGRPADAAQIVGGNAGADGLRVLTTDGRLLQQTGAGGWQSTGTETLTFLVTQQ